MIFLVYLIVLCILLYVERRNKTCSIWCRIIIPILYTLFIGLRGRNIGVDTNTYYEHFYTYGEWGCYFVEIGFDWVNQKIYALGGNANDFFTTISAISVFFIYLSLNKLEGWKYTIPALCFYLLTYTFFVNGIRQGVVVTIFIYSYKFIVEHKIIPYVSLILFASLFHASAYILLPIYFINRVKLPSYIVIAIFIISYAGLFIDITPYIPNLQFGYRDYSEYASRDASQASIIGYSVREFLNILVLVLMLKNKLFKEKAVLSNLVLLSFIFWHLGYNLPFISRMTAYFSWFIYILYPYILFKGCKSLFGNRILTISIIVFINSAIWINAILSPANKLLPYKFYWEETQKYSTTTRNK